MKKFVAMLMTVVMLVSMVGICTAEYKVPTHEEGTKLVSEWARTYGYNKHLDGAVEGNKKYFCGCLSKYGFEATTGCECTAENYVKTMLEYYDLEFMEVKEVGQIEGHAVYLVVGITKEDDEKSMNGYKECEILFMICE